MATTRVRMFKIRRGSTAPSIQAQLISNGVPFDLTGAASVTLVFKTTPGHEGIEFVGRVIPGNEDLPSDSELPNVTYDWASGDTDRSENDYECYWRVIDAGGKEWTFPEDELAMTVRITGR